MKIESNYLLDVPAKNTSPGGYEWWYFDGEDNKGEYQFVVIFYEGCPFSPDYIKTVEKHPEHVNALPEMHPAISISVYKHGKTVFYAMSEYSKTEVEFNRDKISLRVGKNTLDGFIENEQLVYALRLDETLPTGEKFSGILRFVSPVSNKNLFDTLPSKDGERHRWNLVQPKARIKGVISISQENRHEKPIIFEGTGYHDQNIGMEPLRNQFVDWYWGRVHFRDMTLVYYVMEQQGAREYHAWLIGPDNQSIVDYTQNIVLDGNSTNKFLLSSARRISIKFETRTIQVQKEDVVDSGPFYMRFTSAVKITSQQQDENEWVSGIGEYIKPSRIRQRLFWPLVRMRYRYTSKKPHWVQRSSFFYRWTL